MKKVWCSKTDKTYAIKASWKNEHNLKMTAASLRLHVILRAWVWVQREADLAWKEN